MDREAIQKAVWCGVAAGIAYFGISSIREYWAEKKIYDAAKKAYGVALAKVDPQAAAKWNYQQVAEGIRKKYFRADDLRKRLNWEMNQRYPWRKPYTPPPLTFNEYWEIGLSTETKEALREAASKIGLSLDQAREQIDHYNIPKFENPYPTCPRPRAPDALDYALGYGILSSGLLALGGIAMIPDIGLEMVAGIGVFVIFVTR